MSDCRSRDVVNLLSERSDYVLSRLCVSVATQWIVSVGTRRGTAGLSSRMGIPIAWSATTDHVGQGDQTDRSEAVMSNGNCSELMTNAAIKSVCGEYHITLE